MMPKVGPRVRIHFGPGESRVRTCMLAELDQTEESQIDLGRLLVRVAAPPRAAQRRAGGGVGRGRGGSLVCLTVWLEMPLPAARRASGALNLP
jgi:hypothetical protein